MLLQAGLAQEAQEVLRKAQLRSPKSAEILTNRGIALAMTGNAKKAIAIFEKAIAAQPDYFLAHFNHGNTLQLLRRHEEAVASFGTVLRLRPDYADAHVNMALSLLELQRYGEAVSSCEAALSLRPQHVIATYNLAVALQELHRLPEAILRYQEAIALNPEYADAHHGLGIALQMIGRADAAHAALTRAVELAPSSGRLLRDLITSRPLEPGDALIERLQKLSDANLPDADRIHLHAALGKAHCDLGDHRRGFRHFLQANALQRSLIEYDENAELALFARVREIFDSGLLARASGLGDPSDVPIFVVGMPRSGSTLVEQILASHSQVVGGGEIKAFSAAVKTLGLGPFESPKFLEKVRGLSHDQLSQIGRDYLSLIRPLGPAAARITNKFNSNYMCVGLISLCLPRAKIIHAVRNPIDTCVSRFTSVFNAGSSYSYDLAELGRYHSAYEALMEHWRKVLPAGTMMDLAYEDLILEPETQIRGVLAHCGLDWEPECLAFHSTDRVVATPTRLQVRTPIYTSSIGRWKRYAEFLGPLLVALKRDANGNRLAEMRRLPDERMRQD
jgi:tetratricopeptide (TPR) repeat protein